MHLSLRRLAQQLLCRCLDAQPHPLAVHIANVEHFIGAHPGLDRRGVAVLEYQQFRRAIDVNVRGHYGLASHAYPGAVEAPISDHLKSLVERPFEPVKPPTLHRKNRLIHEEFLHVLSSRSVRDARGEPSVQGGPSFG